MGSDEDSEDNEEELTQLLKDGFEVANQNAEHAEQIKAAKKIKEANKNLEEKK